MATGDSESWALTTAVPNIQRTTRLRNLTLFIVNSYSLCSTYRTTETLEMFHATISKAQTGWCLKANRRLHWEHGHQGLHSPILYCLGSPVLSNSTDFL